MGAPTTFNFADIWEAVWPEVPDRTALVCGAQRRSYRELGERTNQLARHLAAAGIGPGDHVGLFLRNGVEYLEAMLAAFTLRAVPVNINYRYVADELRHLVTDSESVALVFHDSLGDAVAGLGPRLLGGMKTLLVVDDPTAAAAVAGEAHATIAGATPYEEALVGHGTEPLPNPGRSGDDHYLMYTGGTTGLPKGVLWRQEDAFFACIGGGDPTRMAGAAERPEDLFDRIGQDISYLPVAPLMHAAAQWTTLSWLFCRRQDHADARLPRSPATCGRRCRTRRSTRSRWSVTRSAARCSRAWLADPDRWDVSSLFAIGNGGAPMSPALKARLAEAFPNVGAGRRVRVVGDRRAGSAPHAARRPGPRATGSARFAAVRRHAWSWTNGGDPVRPGSGVIGRVALRRPHPDRLPQRP